jgi:hypothetical protein
VHLSVLELGRSGNPLFGLQRLLLPAARLVYHCTALGVRKDSYNLSRFQKSKLTLVTMAAIESEAAFFSRAKTIGLSEAVIQAFKDKDIRNFGTYAFCCPYVPGSPDEGPFKAVLSDMLGRDPTLGEAAALRRLYYESHALSLADMKTRVERGETDEPKSLPAPEREVRLQEQRQRLPGVLITPATQPSNALVDRCCQQLEDQMIRYIPLNKCSSREHELSGVEKERSIILDSSGNLKVHQKDKETTILVSTDLQVKDAMLRRALAYDQAGLISHESLHKWIQLLFESMARPSPPGYAPISLDQILQADKELFKHLSEETAAKVSPAIGGGAKPADTAITRLMYSPQIAFFLLPLPKHTYSNAKSQDNSDSNRTDKKRDWKGRNKGKGGKKGDSKGGKSSNSIPDGCVTKWEGKPICFPFNRNVCNKAKPGKRCSYGFHVCWKSNCFKPMPFHKCSHES